jgi:hypothetical protein
LATLSERGRVVPEMNDPAIREIVVEDGIIHGVGRLQ